MGKRGGEWSGCPLGNAEMEKAMSDLGYKQRVAVSLLTEYKASREQTIAMLFSQNTISRAQDAYGIVQPDYWAKTYELNGAFCFMGNLRIDYEDSRCLPIKPSNFNHAAAAVRPDHLLHYIKEVEKVYLQYEEVKAVLRWLNKNATVGGIRYYWPSIMKIAPKDSVFAGMETAPRRYDTPAGIHRWTNALRRSATTVASMVLMPDDATAKPFDKMSVTCHRRKVHEHDFTNEAYETDSVTFSV